MEKVRRPWILFFTKKLGKDFSLTRRQKPSSADEDASINDTNKFSRRFLLPSPGRKLCAFHSRSFAVTGVTLLHAEAVEKADAKGF